MNNLMEYWESLGVWGYWMGLGGVLFLIHLGSVIYQVLVICQKGKKVVKTEHEGVSVVITANNKASFLRENLEYFLKQDYPDFEVIVVDECSEDDTQEVLAEMQQYYPHLKTTRIFPDTKFRSTKKLAMNIGILAARHDIILYAEINCRPLSSDWLASMQAYFTPNTAVVLGYANYSAEKPKTGIRRIFRFMRFLKMILLVRKGVYVLGNGCNMGFRKKFYQAGKVFSKKSQSYLDYDNEIVKVLSGFGEVAVLKDSKTFVIINDARKKTWAEDFSYYYVSKRNWSLPVKILSDANLWIRWGIYILGFLLIYNEILQKYILLCILLTFLIDFVALNIYLKHLKQKKLFLTSLTVSTIGFLYRWYYNVNSIFTRKKWR